MQPAMPPPAPAERLNPDSEGEEEEAAAEGAGEDGEAAAEGAEQPDVEFPDQQPQRMDRGEGDFRRRRGRRSRYRPEGDGAEAREGGGERREPRDQREPREDRHSRENDEPAGQEGFSNGPKPAFLRD
jgi:hypothetical protein